MSIIESKMSLTDRKQFRNIINENQYCSICEHLGANSYSHSQNKNQNQANIKRIYHSSIEYIEIYDKETLYSLGCFQKDILVLSL